MSPPDEFYIGYLPDAPPGLKRYLRRVVLLLLFIACALGGLFAISQQPFAAAQFEFQLYRPLEGILRTAPYPYLLIERPHATTIDTRYTPYLLVAPGKHGYTAPSNADGNRVKLAGSLIYRDGGTVVEVDQGTTRIVGGGRKPIPETRNLGDNTFSGEIVDTKCWFGVMNPGQGKVHHDCAVRCISGGIPPMLVTYIGSRPVFTLLADAEGKPFGPEILDYVAQPVFVRGTLYEVGELRTLEVSSIRRARE